ncbi:hypothetical protein AAD018_018370 [Aestuariibius insulae]|uniref:hypothetical protein n=1 Tax=Aestuariibius insulae TaxID=2058287 RepID=UPI00345E9104
MTRTQDPADLFIPNGSELNAEVVRAAGLASLPFPENIGEDEWRALIALVDDDRLTLWTHEFGHAPRRFGPMAPEAALEQIWDQSYKTQLVQVSETPLYVWVPADVDYFVLFGAPEIVRRVVEAKVFEYGLGDYAAEPLHSAAHRARLGDIARRYGYIR